MSKSIEARAVISAADKTGNVFDKLAQKIKGVEKNAKALGDVKPPRFLGDFNAELQRLKLSEKELQDVRVRRQRMMDELQRSRPRADHYFRAQNDWMDREVNHWRKMKAGIDEAAVAHKRWRQTIVGAAGGVAMRGAAMLGGAYAVARTTRAGISAAGTNQRESARDYLAGMTPEDSKRIEAAALGASRRYQSVDSQTMHERLRDTAMGMRSTDKAIEMADTIGQMTTVLQSLKGKDKAIEEGRKFFAALDVLGKNLDPKEVRELADGYIKALGVEGADMDLGGVLQFARQSRAAGGLLSNRFLMTTMPGLARDLGDAQLGTSLSTSLNQNIGGRATKESKAAQQAMGLRDKNGNFLNSRLAMSDPDRYAWEVLMPAMRKAGVNTDDDLAVTQSLAKLFSNRTVQDAFAKLINQSAQYQGKAEQYNRAPGLNAAGELMKRDPFVAYEAVFSQLRTLAGQAPIMNAAAGALNSLAGAIANLNQTIETGQLPDTRGRRWWRKLTESAEDTNERNRISEMERRLDERERKLESWNLDPQTAARVRLEAHALRGGIYASKNLQNMPPIFTETELKANEDLQLELQRERNRGKYGGRSGVPLPVADPRSYKGEFPPVQPLEGGTARVNVEGDFRAPLEIVVKAEIDSNGLARFVEEVKKTVADLAGKFSTLSANTNGPGSTGRSSPDAQAPGGTGYSGVW